MGDLGNVLTDVVTKQYPILMGDLGNVLTDVVTKQSQFSWVIRVMSCH